MSLFKRKTGELVPPPTARPTWSNRLGNIGDALDTLGHEVRDIAVATHGGPGDSGSIINLLGYRQGQYHVGWASMMYKLDAESVAPLDLHGGVPGEWGSRFRALGALLDEQHMGLRAVTVVDLPAGAAVNAIAQTSEGASLRSLQFTNEQIDAAASNMHFQAAARSTMRTT